MFNEEAKRNGLRINWPKTKRIYAGDGHDPQHIIIGTDPVEFTEVVGKLKVS